MVAKSAQVKVSVLIGQLYIFDKAPIDHRLLHRTPPHFPRNDMLVSIIL